MKLNLITCVARSLTFFQLHNVIETASSADIRNEASPEQKQRVKALERANKERQKREKMYRSQLKKSRSARPD